MTIAVTPRAARCNGVEGITVGEGLNVHDSRLRVYDSQDSQARISGQKSSKRFDKKADKIMEFFLKAGNMGHNRGSWLRVNDLWLGRQYVARKAFSMFRRIGDLINHARISPQDLLRLTIVDFCHDSAKLKRTWLCAHCSVSSSRGLCGMGYEVQLRVNEIHRLMVKGSWFKVHD